MPLRREAVGAAAAPGRDIVVIGASVGGVQALRFLLGRIPSPMGGSILMVLHRSPAYVGNCARVLSGYSPHQVREPSDNERLEPGRVYLAPRDVHMVLEDGRIRLVRGPKEHFTRPAADPLFRSAAQEYGARVVGVVLTGGGHDGLSGLIAIKKAGGLSLVQDPAEAEADSMPRRALADDDVDAVLTLDAMAAELAALMNGSAAKTG